MVAEGRDLGTIIFPNAALKLFVQAPEEVRIARRVKQLHELNLGGGLTDDLVLRAEISERDKRDAERAVAPTIAAQDALLIDNGSRSLTEVVDSLYALAISRGLVTGG
jgi:cytidylate kinase